jgi:hypothetical protein
MRLTESAAEADREETAIDRAKYALSQAEELSAKVKSFADRLCGATPPANEMKQGLTAVSDGLLSDLRAAAVQTERALGNAFEAMSRMERSI